MLKAGQKTKRSASDGSVSLGSRWRLLSPPTDDKHSWQIGGRATERDASVGFQVPLEEKGKHFSSRSSDYGSSASVSGNSSIRCLKRHSAPQIKLFCVPSLQVRALGKMRDCIPRILSTNDEHLESLWVVNHCSNEVLCRFNSSCTNILTQKNKNDKKFIVFNKGMNLANALRCSKYTFFSDILRLKPFSCLVILTWVWSTISVKNRFC